MLIDIPSTTGEEAEVARFLESYLQGLGYDVDFQLVEGERGNLIATTKAPPRIVFVQEINAFLDLGQKVQLKMIRGLSQESLCDLPVVLFHAEPPGEVIEG